REREPAWTRQEGPVHSRCERGKRDGRWANGPGGSISLANERAVLAPKPTRSRTRTDSRVPRDAHTAFREAHHSTPGPRKGQKRAAHARSAHASAGPSPHSADESRAPSETSPSGPREVPLGPRRRPDSTSTSPRTNTGFVNRVWSRVCYTCFIRKSGPCVSLNLSGTKTKDGESCVPLSTALRRRVVSASAASALRPLDTAPDHAMSPAAFSERDEWRSNVPRRSKVDCDVRE
ncbi:unnamed protein product, partial [Ixodes hexagonus]